MWIVRLVSDALDLMTVGFAALIIMYVIKLIAGIIGKIFKNRRNKK